MGFSELPATASDGLSSSVFLFYLSGYLTSRSPTPRQADIYGIFCSAEIFSTSLHQGRELFFVHLLFHFFFAEMTFLAAHAGGHPSGCPHRAGLILSKKKNCQNLAEFLLNLAKFLPIFFRDFPKMQHFSENFRKMLQNHNFL